MSQDLTPSEVAHILRVSVRTIYVLIANRQLLAYRLTTSKRAPWRIAEEDLRAYVMTRRASIRRDVEEAS